ncbi:hypothetical protein HHI36_002277 [Cryptolaemus montrouzieri]|uniref:Tetratricopeptide repeat protein 37 n=1 Tax=Cryptolaemus montrouzieri TaxID=559131 RepID=A0ABD2PA66_9CUCU
MKEFDKCLSPLLKAAKSDPNNYYCFFYLGQFYRYMKEYDKARRCFERSFKLCPNYNEASIELSKMYRILQNWDANIALLQTITEDQINKQNLWAWLQMGLILMEQGDYDEAINYLRSASRIDKKNSHCWESLGDAYLCRGAYASAQEAYEVVLEISNLALYPALQIALIKKDRNCLDEAILDFEALLTMNSNCVLTLTGLAETCLRKARVCYYEQRLGTARDYAQYAVESVTRAIRQCSEISCLWKILGDCCMLVTRLPEKYCCLMIMRALDEGIHVGGDKILEKDDLFQLAAKCYCKALILIEDKQFLWHDLAVCYLNQAENCEDRDIIRKLLTKAQAIIQNCTLTNPRCWQHWNLLGNIALASDPPNYALAQHAFIKAVILDNDCAIAWCNLGILYYKINKIELANKAFAEAQRADPNYTQSWIGKAFVAEIMGQDDEAIDLFRHSISLGFHPQGALGYGHWVCRKLMESPQNSSLYAIQELHAIPVACDALTWYTGKWQFLECDTYTIAFANDNVGQMAL